MLFKSEHSFILIPRKECKSIAKGTGGKGKYKGKGDIVHVVILRKERVKIVKGKDECVEDD
jgi:N-methylhydantoinase B/oxoprolinase/acetone carboxylase alpha subunit